MLVALFVFIASILCPVLVRGAFWFLFRRRNHDRKSEWICLALDAYVNLMVGEATTAVMLACFHAPKVWGSIAFAFSICLFLSLFRMGDWILTWWREKRVPKKQVKVGVFAIAALLAYLTIDGFVLNSGSRSNKTGPETSIRLDSPYIKSKYGFVETEDGAWKATADSPYFIVQNLPAGSRYATFAFDPSNSQMELVIETPNGSSGWTRAMAYDVNANYEAYCVVDLVKESLTYRFTFNFEKTRKTNNKALVFRGLKINAPVNLEFGWLRFWAVAGLGFLLVRIPKLARKQPTDPTEKAKYAKLVLLSVTGVALVTLLIVALCSPRGPDRLLADYPLAESELASYDIYVKLFDAFRKGQLHLDITPDPKLVALGENAYIPSSRSGAGAKVLWDHAFFEGKYYCYFGPAAVLLVSFPVHLVTGAAPTGLFLQFVAFVLILAAMAYLAIILTQVFSFSPNPFAYGAFVLLLCFGGLFFNIVVFRQTDYMYRVAVDYALLGMLLFLCFTLEAYRGYCRKAMLGCAAFAFVSALGSRPDFCFWLIFILPLLLFMLFDKRRSWKARIFDFLPMAVVLLVGVGLLMGYNLARYHKVFEFGQSYQMTSYDTRTLKLSIDALPGAWFHYWLEAPKQRQIFGFITTQFTATIHDYHVYKSSTIGLLYNPTIWLWVFLPVACVVEKRWHWRISFILMPLTVFFLSWDVYSLGGTCFRYMLVLYPVTAIIGLIAFARFVSAPIHSHAKMIGYGVAAAAILGGFYFGANLVSVPFDGMRGEDLWGIFYYGLRDILAARNV